MIPDTAALRGLAETEPTLNDKNSLRAVVTHWFADHPAEFVVAIQLCSDLEQMPIEDASKEGPEDQSPYRPVGRLTLPAQDAWSKSGHSFVKEDLSFCPAHSLSAHRPLGRIMRARMHAYRVLGERRRERKGRPTMEPTACRWAS